MRLAENKVFIEGILSEIDIKEISYEKDGKQVKALGGMLKVRVEQEDNILEIPVHLFSNEYTKKGTKNPAFESIKTVMNSYVSIAAGGEERADAVRISGASVRMNEYYDQAGNLVSYPRITASFINRIKKSDLIPKAEFDVEFTVGQIIEEVDKDGVETGRVKITGIVPQFNGVDIVPFFVDGNSKPKAVDFVKTYWGEGNTVKMHGIVNFTSRVEESVEEVAFGDPIVKHFTVNVSELIGTAGSNPYEGDLAFDNNEIQEALKQRKVRLEESKAKSMSRTKQSTAPAQEGFGSDLGF